MNSSDRKNSARLLHGVRVADVVLDVRVRELLRFDQVMEIRRRVVAHRLEVVGLEQTKHLERRNALAVGRQLPQAIALVRHRHRLHPVGLVRGKVFRRQEPAELLHARRDLLSERSAVQMLRAALRNLAHRRGKIGVPEPLTRFGCARALEQERRGRTGIALQQIDFFGPVVRDDWRDREPFVRDANRRRQRLCEREGAVLLEQRRPPGQRARHRDRLDALRNARPPARGQRLARHERAAAPAGVQAVQVLVLRRPDHGEQVAAHARHVRLHDREHGSGSHRGIDGVASPLQHLEPGGARQRLTGGDHAVWRVHSGAPGHRLDRSRRSRLILSGHRRSE